jgi:hypothetical protein
LDVQASLSHAGDRFGHPPEGAHVSAGHAEEGDESDQRRPQAGESDDQADTAQPARGDGETEHNDHPQ